MTIQAQMPDGSTLEFPDGTGNDVIDRVAKAHIASGPASIKPTDTPTTMADGSPGAPIANGSAPTIGEGAPMPGAAQAGAGLVNQLLGAFQKTTAVTHTMNGQPNYTIAGKYINSDAGPMIDPGNGQPWQMIDPTKHVVLLDQQTGQPQVYNRSPDTDQSLPAALGHFVGLGTMTPSGAMQDATTGAAPAATAAQKTLQDFNQAGVSPNLPAVTGNAGVTMLAQGAKNIPFAGAPVSDAINNNVAEIAQGARSIASGAGNATNAQEGGEALQSGSAAFRGDSTAQKVSLSDAKSTPTRDIGFMQKAGALYDAIPIAPETPASVSATVAELEKLKTNFVSNPDLGAAMQNPAFARFAAAIAPRVEQIAGRNTGLLDASGQPIVTASEAVAKGGLSWDDLKNFRTYVGQQMKQPIGELGLGRDAWKGLYGAVSEDMNATAKAAGSGALQAFNRANTYYSAGIDRINNALSLIDNASSPENAFAKLTKTASERASGADINTLQRAVRSMPDEQRGDFTSAMISRLGLPAKGAVGANPENFSVGSFVSNYSDLADRAKDIMFGPAGTDQRDALDTLARVATSVKNVERLGNPSGTARGIAYMAEGGGLMTDPFHTALGMAGTYLGSAALMSPRVTRWLVGTVDVKSPADMAVSLTRLKGIATTEPAVQPFFDAMSKAAAQPPQGAQQ